jgi:hypothetical protein
MHNFNTVILILSAILVFFIDLSIILTSKDLFIFWAAMVGVFAIHFAMYYYEKRIFTGLEKTANQTKLRNKPLLIFLNIIKNILFFSFYIPVVQIGSGLLLIYGGFLIPIIYLILLNLSTRNETNV